MAKASEIKGRLGGGGVRMKPGFHAGVDFVGAVINEDGTYDLNFSKVVKTDGVEVIEDARRRTWYPISDVKTRGEETPEEAKKRDADERLEPILDVLEIISPKDFETLDFPDDLVKGFDRAVQMAVVALNRVTNRPKVNIKLIPDKKLKYSEFPNFGKWVEKYVEGVEPKFTYSKWELKNRINNPTKDMDIPILGEDKSDDEPFDMFS